MSHKYLQRNMILSYKSSFSWVSLGNKLVPLSNLGLCQLSRHGQRHYRGRSYQSETCTLRVSTHKLIPRPTSSRVQASETSSSSNLSLMMGTIMAHKLLILRDNFENNSNEVKFNLVNGLSSCKRCKYQELNRTEHWEKKKRVFLLPKRIHKQPLRMCVCLKSNYSQFLDQKTVRDFSL